MSAIVALCHPDGRPAEPSRLAVMLAALARRAPDGVGAWTGGSAALGQALLDVSGARRQPSPLVRNGCTIAFAGRIDNGEEVGRGAGFDASPVTDAELALAAYLAWHDDFAGHLLGDFACAIWDSARQRLVCARDAMGQKPLFYHSAPGLVLVASEPSAILAHPSIAHAPDEGVAAEYLTGLVRSREATLNAAVRRVLPAHLLIVDARGCRTRRYWDFNRSASLRYSNDEDYAEHFLELFSRSVACRLEQIPHAAVFTSGGIDSSAVLGCAARFSRERGTRVGAYALRFRGRSCDESAYIDAVVRHAGVPLHAFEMTTAPAETYRTEAAATLDIPSQPNGTILDPLRTAARRAGARVVLTGYGGDDWFTGSPSHTIDLLRRGRVMAALRQLHADASLPGRGYRLASLTRLAIGPFVPRAIRRALARGGTQGAESFPWIRAEFQRRVALADRVRVERQEGFASAATADIHRVATCAAQMVGDELEERTAAAAGVEQRHPFNDRRLAEFALALPESQRWAGRETKVVVRRAMKRAALVPGTVLARDDKAEFSSTFVDALQALGGRTALVRLRTEELGWVDGARAREMYDRMMSLYSRGDETYIQLSGSLWSMLSLELWLEALAGAEAKSDGETSGAA